MLKARGVINQAWLDRQELSDDNDSHSLLSNGSDSSETNDIFPPSNKELCAKLVVDDAWKRVRGH